MHAFMRIRKSVYYTAVVYIIIIYTRATPVHMHARSKADPREIVPSRAGSEQRSASALATLSRLGAANYSWL